MASLIEDTLINVSAHFKSEATSNPLLGTAKPLNQLRQNDVTLGSYGSRGLLSDEVVLRVASNDKIILYGFNDDKPFFTSAQVFWTVHGWKSISPDRSTRNNSKLTIRPLEVGDIVFRISASSEVISYAPVLVSAITETNCPSGTVLRGLHLREGSKSFHANGYLVAENAPELTAASVSRNIVEKLSGNDREIFLKEFRRSNIWSKMLGTGVLPAIVKAYGREEFISGQEQVKTSKNKALVPVEEFKVDLLYSRYVKHLFVKKDVEDNATKGMVLSLVRGTVLRNHQTVDLYQMDGLFVYWNSKDANGEEEYGAARMDPSGLCGKIAVQTRAGLSHAVISSGKKKYAIYVKNAASKTYALSNLRVVIDDEDGNVSGYIAVNEDTVSGELIFKTDGSTGMTKIQINDLSTSDVQPYVTMEVVFSENMDYLTGTVANIDGDCMVCNGILASVSEMDIEYADVDSDIPEEVANVKEIIGANCLSQTQQAVHERALKEQFSTAKVPTMPLCLPAIAERIEKLSKAYDLGDKLEM